MLDDGRVIGHVSADDVAKVEQIEHRTIEEAHEAEQAPQIRKEEVRFFSPVGRYSRAGFLGGVAAIQAAQWAAVYFAAVMTVSGPDLVFVLGGLVVGLGFLAFPVVKRLHDLDRPAVHYCLLLVPGYNLYLLGLLFGRQGTTGTNQYGPDPLVEDD